MSRVGVVLGGADSVWSDLERLGTLLDLSDAVIIATNDAGVAYDGHLHHWVTLHAEKMPAWEEARARLGKPKTYTTWGRVYPYGKEHLQALCERSLAHDKGSSGMLAVEVAVVLKCRPIVLCGVPLDPVPHFFNDEAWEAFKGFRHDWVRRQDWLEDHHVYSMSGWTARLLGQPTPDRVAS